MWHLLPYAHLAAHASPGCGSTPPVEAGSWNRFPIEVEDASQESGYATRHYLLDVPAVYKRDTPAMLILDYHGFYDHAKSERNEDQLRAFVDQQGINAVTVYPVGSGDQWSGDSFAWNVEGNGINTDNGPLGPTCLAPRRQYDGWNDRYTCFDSCSYGPKGCDATWGCNFASCMDDNMFTKRLIKHLTHKLCIDLSHIHVTGISAGALMVYQVALDFSDLVASAAPVAGSRIYGYNYSPNHAVALLDVHGLDDVYVPSNRSNGFEGSHPHGTTLSHDRFIYHEVPHVMKSFASTGQCGAGGNLPYPTKFDGTREFSCNQPHGTCTSTGVSIVQCVGRWGHTWPLHNVHPFAYADLVLDFFRRHPKSAGAEAWAPPKWLFDEEVERVPE